MIWFVGVVVLKRGKLRSELSWTNQNTNNWLINWEELHEEGRVASRQGPRHRGCVLLSVLVSGLLGLNLLDALSAIIAERAQGRGADVTWSTGWRLGNYVGQVLDCCDIGNSEGKEWGAKGEDCRDWTAEEEVEVSVSWGQGEKFRAELLRDEGCGAGLTQRNTVNSTSLSASNSYECFGNKLLLWLLTPCHFLMAVPLKEHYYISLGKAWYRHPAQTNQRCMNATLLWKRSNGDRPEKGKRAQLQFVQERFFFFFFFLNEEWWKGGVE